MSDRLLPEQARERLTTTCRTAVGDSLRSITYFSRTDYAQVYLRGDLERDADLGEFIGTEWQDFNMTQDGYGGTELGGYRFTIRVFDNGYLVRITTDDDGVFVTTDGLTMQDFQALESAVRSTLEEWGVDE